MKIDNLSPEIFRVIDANINRLKEAIRVVEDIARYHNNDKKLSSKLKRLRHRVKINNKYSLLSARDSVRDVLKQSTKSEMRRDNLQDIVTANFKRSQESARVLEEITKLIDIQTSATFKEIRYILYQIEKKFVI